MTSKEKQAAQLTGTCMIAFAVIIVSVFAVNWHKQRFFPSYEPGTDAELPCAGFGAREK